MSEEEREYVPGIRLKEGEILEALVVESRDDGSVLLGFRGILSEVRTEVDLSPGECLVLRVEKAGDGIRLRCLEKGEVSGKEEGRGAVRSPPGVLPLGEEELPRGWRGFLHGPDGEGWVALVLHTGFGSCRIDLRGEEGGTLELRARATTPDLTDLLLELRSRMRSSAEAGTLEFAPVEMSGELPVLDLLPGAGKAEVDLLL